MFRGLVGESHTAASSLNVDVDVDADADVAEPLLPVVENSDKRLNHCPHGGTSEHLSKGLLFVESDAASTCLFMRVSFEQLRLYMSRQLGCMSAAWEHKTRLSEAKVIGVGSSVAKDGDRWFPLSSAACNVLEYQFHKQQRRLFDKELWEDIVLELDLTVRNNVFAFQLVSGADSAVWDLITEMHERELKVFRLDKYPDLSTELLELIQQFPCLLDPFTFQHVQDCSALPGGLLGPDAVMMRRQIMRLAPLAIHHHSVDSKICWM